MTIKQQGGIFGRKPTFSDVTTTDLTTTDLTATNADINTIDFVGGGENSIQFYTSGGTLRVIEGVIHVSGSGTVITIPHVSQGSANRQFTLEFTVCSLGYNSVSYGGRGFVHYRTLTSVSSISALEAIGSFSSAAGSGMNLNLTFGNTLVNPIFRFRVMAASMALIDLENVSIA